MCFFCVLGHVWVFVNSKLIKDLERGGCDVAGVLAQNVTEYLVSRLTVKNELNYVVVICNKNVFKAVKRYTGHTQ